MIVSQFGSRIVACGAASHLRLKLREDPAIDDARQRRMWSGFSSEIETTRRLLPLPLMPGRMWSGFSSEGRNYSPNRMRRRDAAFIEMPVVLLVPFLRNVS